MQDIKTNHMHTKTFNLEEAKAGKECVTFSGNASCFYKFSITNARDGGRHIFKCILSETEFIVIVDDDGKAHSGDYEDNLLPWNDLSMKCEEKEYWIATGISTVGNNTVASFLKSTEGLAILDLTNNCETLDQSTIQTHKITRYE